MDISLEDNVTMSKKNLTISQVAQLGGIARAKKLSKERQLEIATKASMAAKKAREDKKKHENP